MTNLDLSRVRGFNYHPSTGTSCMEIWNHFDAGKVAAELGTRQEVLPRDQRPSASGYRTIRSTGTRNRFCARFSEALAIADSYGLAVMPVSVQPVARPPH